MTPSKPNDFGSPSPFNVSLYKIARQPKPGVFALSLLPSASHSQASRAGVTFLAIVGSAGIGVASFAAPKLLLLGTAFAIVVALYLLSRLYALLLFVAARPLVDALGGTFSEFGLSASSWWAVGVTAIAVIVLLQESRARSLGLSPRVLPVFALILGYIFAVAVERASGGVLYVTSAFALTAWALLCLAIGALSESRESQRAVVLGIDAAAITLSVSVLVLVLRNQYGALYYSADHWSTWNPVTMALPHTYALFAVMLMPIVLAQIHARYHVRLAAVLSVTLSLVVILSYVRSSYLALIIVWVVFVAQAVGTSPARVRLTAAVVSGGAAIAFYVSRAEILHRVSDLQLVLLPGSSADAAGSGRWGFWQHLLERATDTNTHLLFGQGAGASRRILLEFMGVGLWSHNDFLEVLVAGGLVLLAIFCVFVGWMLASILPLARDSLQTLPSRRFAVLALAGTCSWVLVAFTNGAAFYQSSVALGVLVGLSRAMRLTPRATWLDSVRQHQLP